MKSLQNIKSWNDNLQNNLIRCQGQCIYNKKFLTNKVHKYVDQSINSESLQVFLDILEKNTYAMRQSYLNVIVS